MESCKKWPPTAEIPVENHWSTKFICYHDTTTYGDDNARARAVFTFKCFPAGSRQELPDGSIYRVARALT